jgi:hypothetical protein
MAPLLGFGTQQGPTLKPEIGKENGPPPLSRIRSPGSFNRKDLGNKDQNPAGEP